MKKLLSLLLALMLIASLTLAMSSCDEENPDENDDGPTDEEVIEDALKDTFEFDFTLSPSGTYYIVTGFGVNYVNSVLTIPSTYKDLPVREIANNAFTANLPKNVLESITIPSSVVSIGNFAFSGCEKLKSVTLSSGLTHIGEGAFRDCSFESIIIPDTVGYIGDYAFDQCSNLKNVVLSSSLTHLGRNPFRACINIIGNKATPFGGVYTVPTSDGKMWVVSSARDTTDANLPDNTVGIAADAFDRSTGLVTVEIPKNVAFIGESAFSKCESLATVNYGGTADEWIVINIGNDNIPLLEADRSFS